MCIRFERFAVGVVMVALLVGGCAHPHVRTLEAYRAAKKRHDYDAVRKYLADDARIWHDQKEGPGRPLRPKGGPWADWDRVMNSTSTKTDMKVRGNAVTYLSTETNDYYKSLERTTHPARITYYFGTDGKITGMFYDPMREKRGPADRPPRRVRSLGERKVSRPARFGRNENPQEPPALARTADRMARRCGTTAGGGVRIDAVSFARLSVYSPSWAIRLATFPQRSLTAAGRLRSHSPTNEVRAGGRGCVTTVFGSGGLLAFSPAPVPSR